MPKQYEAIRNKFQREGMPQNEAQQRVAKIYNSKHPGHPMKPHRKRK